MRNYKYPTTTSCFLGLIMITYYHLQSFPHPEIRVEILESTKAEASKFSAPAEPTLEAFVISFAQARVEAFRRGNSASNQSIGKPPLWVPAVSGTSQLNLDLWQELTGRNVNLSEYEQLPKKDPTGPHMIGCYLAHWHLLRALEHRLPKLRPDAYAVFEDDAMCVPNWSDRTLRTVQQLPPDWDILYIGGKPFTHFKNNGTYDFSLLTDVNPVNGTETLRRDICNGAFGVGESPLSPASKRNLSQAQPFWRPRYLTNTDAYVVNPKRMNHVMDIVNPKPVGNLAFDLILANSMQSQKLKAFMTPEMLCVQERRKDLNEPIPWSGYFMFDMLPDYAVNMSVTDDAPYYIWSNQILLDDCECVGVY